MSVQVIDLACLFSERWVSKTVGAIRSNGEKLPIQSKCPVEPVKWLATFWKFLPKKPKIIRTITILSSFVYIH